MSHICRWQLHHHIDERTDVEVCVVCLTTRVVKQEGKP